ncbi:hypothetical protein GN958_ATG18179, partial [Phytophthora infestans]
ATQHAGKEAKEAARARLEEEAVNKEAGRGRGGKAEEETRNEPSRYCGYECSSSEQRRASEVTGAVAAPQVVLDAAATTTDEPCTDEMEINGLDSVCDDDDEELVFAAEEDAVAHDPQNNVNSLNADSESTAPVALSKSADEVGGDESFVKVELDEESDFNWH